MIVGELDDVDDEKRRRHPVDAEVLPWKPTFDQTDDLGGLLEARGPLLARAFGGQVGGDRSADVAMDVIASLEAPCAAEVLFELVDDLSTYPQWNGLVHSRRARRRSGVAGRAARRLGPLARSKRLRMVRTRARRRGVRVTFERDQATAAIMRRGCSRNRRRTRWAQHADMHLHYGGALWTGGVLERVLADQITKGRERLLQLVRPRTEPAVGAPFQCSGMPKHSLRLAW